MPPPVISLVSEKAKMVMWQVLDFCIYLHQNNFGLRQIETDKLLVRKGSYLPCFQRDALVSLPEDDELQRLEMMKDSFRHVKNFFKDHLFGPLGHAPPYDLSDFFSLLELPSTVSNQRELDLWSSLLKDHVVLKTDSECVEYLKTILDRSRELDPPLDGQWDMILDHLSHLQVFDNWVEKIRSKPHSMWNFTLAKSRREPGNEIADLIRCLRDLIRDLSDEFHMDNNGIYCVIADVFPELILALHREIHGAPELRAYLMS